MLLHSLTRGISIPVKPLANELPGGYLASHGVTLKGEFMRKGVFLWFLWCLQFLKFLQLHGEVYRKGCVSVVSAISMTVSAAVGFCRREVHKMFI